jgi:hypothetical protein
MVLHNAIVKAMGYQEIEEECRRLYRQLNEQKEEFEKDEGPLN